MNIFAFVGSNRGKDSSTYMVVEHLVNEICEKKSDNYVAMYTSRDIRVSSCMGCKACFQGLRCPQDKKDDFLKIKKEMLKSDIIILGTPVYAGTVSGEMKNLIDRISSWLHTMPLIGKMGISIVTASGNHLQETNNYQRNIMEMMGLVVVKNILFTVDSPPMLEDQSYINEKLKRDAQYIIQCMQNRELIQVSGEQQLYYYYFRKLLMEGGGTAYEREYWEKSGYLESNHLNETIAKR